MTDAVAEPATGEGMPAGEEEEVLEEAVPYVAPPGAVTTVAGLRPGTSGHKLTLKVLSSKTVRPGSRMSESLVGDTTGVVVMTARNAQIDVVKPGATIDVKNGAVELYKVRAAGNLTGPWPPCNIARYRPRAAPAEATRNCPPSRRAVDFQETAEHYLITPTLPPSVPLPHCCPS